MMPKCTCTDFTRTGLPCKHFFAVFEHSQDWKWDALPERYRENPHVSLDNAIVFGNADYDEFSISEGQTDPQQPMVPQPKVQPRMATESQLMHEAMKCRETMKEITSLTYNVVDLNALQELGSSLKALKDKFSSFQPTDEKENGLDKTINEKRNNERPRKEYLPLPQRRKRSAFTNRIGQYASTMRSQYYVNVPVDGNIFVKKRKKQPKKSVPGKKQHQQLIKQHIVKQQPSGKRQASQNKANEANLLSSPKKRRHDDPTDQLPPSDAHNINENAPDQKSWTSPTDPEPNEIDKNDQVCPVENPVDEGLDITIKKDDKKTSSSSPPVTHIINDNSPDPKAWVKLMDPQTSISFVLYQDARDNILKKTHWLFDSEIHAGQILLKEKFPFVDGLCDPAVKGELVVPAVSEFVQVINTGSHWVCLSTISAIPGTIKIYDSLFIRPSPIAIDHSCRLLMHTGNQVTFLNEKVQKQTNTNDCGLFALAFATDLCHGIDPVSQCYHPQHMRDHYVHCLDSQAMVPFPKT